MSSLFSSRLLFPSSSISDLLFLNSIISTTSSIERIASSFLNIVIQPCKTNGWAHSLSYCRLLQVRSLIHLISRSKATLLVLSFQTRNSNRKNRRVWDSLNYGQTVAPSEWLLSPITPLQTLIFEKLTPLDPHFVAIRSRI